MKILPKSMIFSTFLVCATATSAVPAGTNGKDWALVSFEIQSNASVLVTATNSTINVKPGNKTRIVIMKNGAIIKDQTVDNATFSVSTVVSGKGKYEMTAICYNENADADTCSITTQKVTNDVPIY